MYADVHACVRACKAQDNLVAQKRHERDSQPAAMCANAGLQVRTDAAGGDVYELEVQGERGSLALKDFCRLERTAPLTLTNLLKWARPRPTPQTPPNTSLRVPA